MLYPSAVATVVGVVFAIYILVDAIFTTTLTIDGALARLFVLIVALVFPIHFLHTALKIRKLLELIYGEKILTVSELCAKTKYSEK
jgi:hypothetical protein